MNLLADAGISDVYHYTPLHYLPFIARSTSLKSKPMLQKEGFELSHFRSMSRHHDVSRGFGGYIHLTTHACPPILAAKLAGGFPHIRLTIPTTPFETQAFDLCRFNVAMTRQLRRKGKRGFPESASNGRYYEEKQIPVARTEADKGTLLSRHASRGDMIEVLIPNSFVIPQTSQVDAFSADDLLLVSTILNVTGPNWKPRFIEPSTPYPRSNRHGKAVVEFVEQALADPEWRGNGLEFDRVVKG
jgi:hypothetical protein